MPGLLAVDPGIRGTGLALFDRGEKAPRLTSNICPIHSDTWGKRLHYVLTLYEEFLYQHKPGEVFIEQPEAWLNTKLGLMAARNGDLVKLAMITGALYWATVGFGADCNTVLPSQWKGRKSKDDVHSVILRLIPTLQKPKRTTHELDAVGLGLYAKGYIKQGSKRNV